MVDRNKKRKPYWTQKPFRKHAWLLGKYIYGC